MGAILKKELKLLFLTPLGYVVIAIFNFLSALMFYFTTLDQNTSDTTGFFNNLIVIIIVVVAILTMKIFSEERRSKTDQLLLTSPVSLTEIVFGKFFAGLIVYVCALLVSIIFIIILGFLGPLEIGVIIGNYLGLILLGAALIAVGIFVSSLTQSQIVSAVITFVAFFLMLLSSTIVQNIRAASVSLNKIFEMIITSFFSIIAIYDKYSEFSRGMLDISAIIYYITFALLFLFLTIRVLEKRRWS